MLKLTIMENDELFDESTSEFVSTVAYELTLEHSLLSVSKWEAEFEKPFLGSDQKTSEQTLWYIKAMTVTPGIPAKAYSLLTNDNLLEIYKYINSKQTATWFSAEENRKQSRKIITSEIMYYWMFSLGIDRDFENRHLNHFLTLVRVFNQENTPKKKMSPRQIAAQQKALNDQRRAQLGTRG